MESLGSEVEKDEVKSPKVAKHYAPTRWMLWVASASELDEHGQGPLEWKDPECKVRIKSENKRTKRIPSVDSSAQVKTGMISSSADTLMPPSDPDVVFVLPKLAQQKDDATLKETRRSKRNKEVNGHNKGGDDGLKFEIFGTMRLVFNRFLTWDMYDKAWGRVKPASMSVTEKDWNCNNIFIHLWRHLIDPKNEFEVLRNNFSQSMMDRVNEYRRTHPGFMSLAENAYRYDEVLDAAANSGVQDLIFE